MRSTQPGAGTSVVDPTRRYALLSALQWLPVGLMMVPTVLLLLLERGFSLGEIAAIAGVSSVAVAILELPTGGLADVWGRRPVLVISALAHAVALLVLGLAAGMVLLLVSAGLRGLARALATGPLEAWFVDTLRAMGPVGGDDAHLAAGLARGEVAASVALAVGTLVGGLPLILAEVVLPVPALAVPILLAAAAELVRVALTVGMPDPQRAADGAPTVLRGIPAAVASGLRLAGRDRLVLRLLLVSAATGVALAVLELITPAWLGGVAAGPERAALAYAVLVTAGFGADALGASLAPAARRRAASPVTASAIATAVALAGVSGLAGASLLAGSTALLVAGVAYLVSFLGLGATGPLLGEVLHGQVADRQRATVLSVQSLSLQLSGARGRSWPELSWHAVAPGSASRRLHSPLGQRCTCWLGRRWGAYRASEAHHSHRGAQGRSCISAESILAPQPAQDPKVPASTRSSAARMSERMRSTLSR